MENFNRYLAYLDILGFKEMIENNTLQVIEGLYSTFEPSILYSMGRTNIDYLLNDYKLSGTKLAPIETTNLNTLVISDSILIWTDDTNPNNFVQLVTTVKHHLHLSMKLGIPLRGAITYGQLSTKFGRHENSPKQNSFATLLGLPLTKAYVLENRSEWSGCVIDNSCIEEYEKQIELNLADNPNCIKLDGLIRLDILNKYFVPMKVGKLEEFYCINWTNYFLSDQISEEDVRKSFKSHNKKSDNWEVETKIRNTIDYLNTTKKSYQHAIDYLAVEKATQNIDDLKDLPY